MAVRFLRKPAAFGLRLLAAELGLLVMLIMVSRVSAQPPAPPSPEGGEPAEAEHLLRGPLHESFAEPVRFNPEPTLVAPKSPPETIDERPPETKPAGNSIWIPGYWAWDDEREDFLWVSGVWRVPPPERRWVPGFWQQQEDGSQWVSGFWAPLQEAQVRYLPQPPATVERGPSSPAPSDNHFWVKGHWRYGGGRYVWSPGYWARGNENWVWVPTHYTWTPRGCIYVPGYWDYQLIDRGICFAPVYWHRPIYTRPGYYYRPLRLIDLAHLSLHLFVRPQYGHYYYGDWYGPYGRIGIYPTYAFHGQYGYDPLWTYNRWYFGRRGIDYDDRIRSWHRYFERHEDLRPPHTWDAQQQFVRRNPNFRYLSQVVLGEDLEEYINEHPRSVERISEPFRERMRDNAEALRELVQARRDAAAEGGLDEESPVEAEEPTEVLSLPETPHVRDARERFAERIRREEDVRTDGGRFATPPAGRPDLRPGEAPPAGPRPETPVGPDRPEPPAEAERPQAPIEAEGHMPPIEPQRPETPAVPEGPETPVAPERPETPMGVERPEAAPPRPAPAAEPRQETPVESERPAPATESPRQEAPAERQSPAPAAEPAPAPEAPVGGDAG